MAKLGYKKMQEIIYELKNSWSTQVIIAKQFNVTTHTITRINTGKTYNDPDIEYPIRKQRRSVQKLESMKVSPGKARAINIQNELQADLFPMKEIAKKYDVSISTVSRINSGERHYRIELAYPLRMTDTQRAYRIREEAENGVDYIIIQNKYDVSYKILTGILTRGVKDEK